MSEPTETPDQAVDGPENVTGQTDGTGKGNREAARYRTQLREAETALEAANARIESMQRAEVHRLAGSKLAEPADVDLAGLELSDYLDADGNVDAEKVAEATTSVLTSRPGLAKRVPATDPMQGSGQSGPYEAQPSWSDLLR